MNNLLIKYKEIYDEYWRVNSLKVAEATKLLDLLEKINSNIINNQLDKIKLIINNRSYLCSILSFESSYNILDYTPLLYFQSPPYRKYIL